AANNIARWSSQCYASIVANGSTSICTGSSVRLDVVTASGLGYQWQLNGVDISGATASSYFASAAGNYSCNVSNTCGGSITTNTLSVSIVNNAPSATITAGGPTSFCTGTTVTLSANTGSGLSYQWQKDGVNIAPVTSTYTASSTGSYTC